MPVRVFFGRFKVTKPFASVFSKTAQLVNFGIVAAFYNISVLYGYPRIIIYCGFEQLCNLGHRINACGK